MENGLDEIITLSRWVGAKFNIFVLPISVCKVLSCIKVSECYTYHTGENRVVIITYNVMCYTTISRIIM